MRAGSADNMCASMNYGDDRLHQFVAHVISACGAKGTDHITIAGRRAIQSVLDLCRRGYLHVTCNTAAPGPHLAVDRADSLWILNVPSETELLALIATHGHDLRAGGRLIVGYEVPISPIHAARLERVLLDNGFVTERQQTDPAARTLLICSRQEHCAQARAAEHFFSVPKEAGWKRCVSAIHSEAAVAAWARSSAYNRLRCAVHPPSARYAGSMPTRPPQRGNKSQAIPPCEDPG